MKSWIILVLFMCIFYTEINCFPHLITKSRDQYSLVNKPQYYPLQRPPNVRLLEDAESLITQGLDNNLQNHKMQTEPISRSAIEIDLLNRNKNAYSNSNSYSGDIKPFKNSGSSSINNNNKKNLKQSFPEVDNRNKMLGNSAAAEFLKSHPIGMRIAAAAEKKVFQKRQDATTARPVEITSVSPIESSFGGLTGLQGLPSLSIVNSLKLLVALFPFIIPIIFVPLLFFSVGILLIPVFRVHRYIGDESNVMDDGNDGESRSLLRSYLSEFVVKFTKNLEAHEKCVERISCEVSHRISPSGSETRSLSHEMLKMILGNYEYPITSRIAQSLSQYDCTSYSCGVASFIEQKYIQ